LRNFSPERLKRITEASMLMSQLAPDFVKQFSEASKMLAALDSKRLAAIRSAKRRVTVRSVKKITRSSIAAAVALRYGRGRSHVARARRSPSRFRRVVNADSGGGGDGSGQGGSDPDSDPPRHLYFVTPPKCSNPHSPFVPWPRHGCCRVERGRPA
jgi:hypothetical protein